MFSELYRVVGLTRGADVFNAFLVAMLAPCILGAVPYVFMRRKAPAAGVVRADDV